LNIRLQFQPAPENAEVPSFAPSGDCWLDLNQKALVLTAGQEKDPGCLRLARIIREELTGADRKRLREWFLAEKLDLIQSTPVSRIDIAGLPDADDGKMIGFVDVFPCGLALHFELANEAWAADEQYCVQAGCRCKETVLSFLKLVDASGRRIKVIRDAPAVRYNYHTHAAKPLARGPSGTPPPDVLLAALMGTHANVDAQLELRHLILQALYARHYIERTQSPMQSPAAAPPRKIGRNEPCPCGSGRKYKHCCLNKS
jgi:hypothetical protein